MSTLGQRGIAELLPLRKPATFPRQIVRDGDLLTALMALEVVLGLSRLGRFDVVLTDFERTIVRLFEDLKVEQRFFEDVWRFCAKRGVPASVRRAAGESPYSLWTKAHRWMSKHVDPLHADRMYHVVAKIATEYEMDAAESAKLFYDVKPVLERLQIAKIPVVIVSNNATEAVERVLKENNAEGLVRFVVGRQHVFRIVNLKPGPDLLLEALKRSARPPGMALLVGDSVDDMEAGQAAGIGLRVGLLDHSTVSKRQLCKAGATMVLHRFGDLLPLVPGGGVSEVR